MDDLEKIVEIVDYSIKKLTSPTLILVASAVVSEGINKPDVNNRVIYMTVGLLIICAFTVMSGSLVVTLNKLAYLNLGNIRKIPLMLVFTFVYLLLFVALVLLAVSKI